ncbi:MAG: hypothetical protein V4555_08250 [Acidobacteriota bacterium]
MAESFDPSKLAEYRAVLHKLCECLENISIESDACWNVALAHGATFYELQEAKQAALLDPQIRKQAREDYSAMWKALEASGEAAFFEDLLQSLPTPEKPN